MAAALFGKKDPNKGQSASAPCGEAAAGIEQLVAQLARLGELLAQANQQIAAYLVRRESGAGQIEAAQAASGELGQQIAALGEKLDRLAAAGPAPSMPATPAAEQARLKSLIEALVERMDRVAARVEALSESGALKGADHAATGAAVLDAARQLQARLDGGFQRLAELLAPPQGAADAALAAPATSRQWEEAILGAELAANEALAFQRQRLMSGILEGDPSACALAGQLLVFQAAPPERLPQLLKDIGEAFYRWLPKDTPESSLMEQSLVGWLQRRCEAAGIHNTIALVHPGERFDSARHTAASRGVEVTAVQGWIVLRDNGKVYTKAAVEVR